MLQKPLSILLIFLTLSSGFTKLYLYAGYELNKNYIAAVLCENKAKPEMHCNGKCYLAKKLKQAEKSEQKSEQTNSKRFFADHFLITVFRFKSFIRQTAFYLPCPDHRYYSLAGNSIFHPPQA
jgi:hypothetical protein